uniref:Uncharacterized protein n=1 Tax=Oryza rufipogon TaxID=4529 RepID=A0A0E0QCP8_ORYRU
MGASSLLYTLDIMFTSWFLEDLMKPVCKVKPDCKVIERARPWAPFFLAGLVSTAYGMVIVFFAGGQPASAFFLGDFGVCFILVGLIVIIARSQHERTQDDKGLWAASI